MPENNRWWEALWVQGGGRQVPIEMPLNRTRGSDARLKVAAREKDAVGTKQEGGTAQLSLTDNREPGPEEYYSAISRKGVLAHADLGERSQGAPTHRRQEKSS